METLRQLTIRVDPQLTADELFAFYERNNICEVGFGKEGVTRILQHPHVMVAAFDGDELVALARATFDGLSAHVMEFSVDLRWQGETRHRNGSLVEADPKGVGLALGRRLLARLIHEHEQANRIWAVRAGAGGACPDLCALGGAWPAFGMGSAPRRGCQPGPGGCHGPKNPPAGNAADRSATSALTTSCVVF